MGFFSLLWCGFAGYLEDIYLDSFDFASRNNNYEPKLNEDKAQYKATHKSKLEQICERFSK